MWLLDSIAEIFHKYYSPRDEISEAFIEKQYFKLFQASGFLFKFDKRRWIRSILQLIFYYFVLIYHWILIATPSWSLFNVNFVIFVQSIHFCLVIYLVTFVITFFQFKREEILMIHKAIATNFFDYSEDYKGATAQLQAKMLRKKMILLPIPVLAFLSTAGFIIFAPIVNQYGTFDFNKTATLVNDNMPFAYAKYPYETKEGVLYYLSVFLQMSCSFVLTSVIVTGTIAYINISENISMQLEILLDSLENIEIRTARLLAKRFGGQFKISARNKYSPEEFSQCYKISLHKNFQHHQIILRNFNHFTSMYSVPVLMIYIIGTIVIAFSLLSISSWTELPGTTIASMVLCLSEISHMFLYSVCSQRITDLNDKLRFKIYCLKWYDCDEQVKRSLRVFQIITLRPLTLVAGGIIPANMDTFATVMSNSYSYYNLVNAIM